MLSPRTTIRTLILLALAAAPLSAQQQRFSLDHFRRIVGVTEYYAAHQVVETSGAVSIFPALVRRMDRP
jgi:hypothetical protein